MSTDKDDQIRLVKESIRQLERMISPMSGEAGKDVERTIGEAVERLKSDLAELEKDEWDKLADHFAREFVEFEEEKTINCLKRHNLWKYMDCCPLQLGFKIQNLERELKEIKGILEVNDIRNTAYGWKYTEDNSISENLIDYMIHLESIVNKL